MIASVVAVVVINSMDLSPLLSLGRIFESVSNLFISNGQFCFNRTGFRSKFLSLSFFFSSRSSFFSGSFISRCWCRLFGGPHIDLIVRGGLFNRSSFFDGCSFFNRCSFFNGGGLFNRCGLFDGSRLFSRCGLFNRCSLFNGSRLFYSFVSVNTGLVGRSRLVSTV